jgi:hypothetical protein
MARPSELTPSLIGLVAQEIGKGNYPEIAARVAGISRSTYYGWLARGRTDEEAGRETLHRQFLDAVKEAEAAAEGLLVETIRLASIVAPAQGQKAPAWTAAAWILERRWPRRWGEGLKAAAQQEEHLRALLAKVKSRVGDALYSQVVEALSEADGTEPTPRRAPGDPADGPH